ncbi:hypothetical protein FA95DRAFT_213654 [Auriscalpium vulgare]|uniref:Uncharacterized protein n=1 Tax=Auriscalpium vulgare TaxID=40419 RepID=A0ACB8RME7_9AGAM|nr:hypothetical protein FA95DRAFT_213654 [Auriscalpium vulgare]
MKSRLSKRIVIATASTLRLRQRAWWAICFSICPRRTALRVLSLPSMAVMAMKGCCRWRQPSSTVAFAFFSRKNVMDIPLYPEPQFPVLVSPNVATSDETVNSTIYLPALVSLTSLPLSALVLTICRLSSVKISVVR